MKKKELKEINLVCSHPIIIRGRVFGCGKCWSCKQKRVREWRLKNSLQAKYCRKNGGHSFFITLTYDNLHLPSGGLINYKDVQDWLKRIRKNNPFYTIKYFGCAEYGSKEYTERPHYHIILHVLPPNIPDFKNFLLRIRSSWFNGFTDCRLLSVKDVNYITKYANKLMEKEKVDPNTGEVIAEKIFFSKGLGKTYIQDCSRQEIEKRLKKGFFEISGQKYAIPRIFKKYILDLYDENMLKILKDREKQIFVFSVDGQVYHDANLELYLRENYYSFREALDITGGSFSGAIDIINSKSILQVFSFQQFDELIQRRFAMDNLVLGQKPYEKRKDIIDKIIKKLTKGKTKFYSWELLKNRKVQIFLEF